MPQKQIFTIYTKAHNDTWNTQLTLLILTEEILTFLMLSSQPDHQNLTHQIFKATQVLVKDSDHPSKYFPSNI